MKKKKIVILPAFNEGRQIASVLDKLSEYTDADILVIDDGSTDDTYNKARASRIPDKIIRHDVNGGYGLSLIKGFEYSIQNGYESVVTMDCDDQHEPEKVEQFFLFTQEADIVSGSRYLSESPVISDAPADRLRINNEVTGIINSVTGLSLTDAFCGFKGYRASSLKKLELIEKGYGLPLQLWIQAACKGLDIMEIPVALIYHSRSSFPGMLAYPEKRLEYYIRLISEELERIGSLDKYEDMLLNYAG